MVDVFHMNWLELIDPITKKTFFINKQDGNTLHKRVDLLCEEPIIKSTHFFQACKSNNIELVKLAIKLGININYTDENGNTPLMIASKYGNNNIVKILLSEEIVSKCELKTEFEELSEKYLEKTNQLIGPIQINARSHEGKTALYYACEGNNTEIIRMLLDKNADQKISDNKNITPLESAKRENNIQAMKILLEY